MWLIILASLGWLDVFLCWRALHDGFATGVLRIRGINYDRAGEPAWFWVNVAFCIFFLLFGAVLALVTSLLLIGALFEPSLRAEIGWWK
jgi:hypothetical protein